MEEMMIRENCFIMPNDGRKEVTRVPPYREGEERQPTVSTLYTSGNVLPDKIEYLQR